MFDLKLEFGPYYIDYTRNGQQLLIAGKKGQVALLDWKSKTLKNEFHLKETIRDIKSLFDSNLFAVIYNFCIGDDFNMDILFLGGSTKVHLYL